MQARLSIAISLLLCACSGSSTGDVDDEGPFEDRGVPGCGLDAAAFCETFDAPTTSSVEGRTAELSGERWSGERMEPGVAWGNAASAVGPASIPSCRGGLPALASPGGDFLICDPSASIQSRHLLVLAAEQNYGQASVRIRQRVDFTEEMRRIVFDADARQLGLHGWMSISITETPSPAPSFGQAQNYENGAIARHGISVHFLSGCGEGKLSVSLVSVTDDWAERIYSTSSGEAGCVTQVPGQMNHFELRLSRDRLEVWATDASPDGVSFGELTRLFEVEIALSFGRGYVHLNTHNHATLKYSDGAIDAWTTRYDNVGFDGPIVDNGREYSLADAMVPVAEGEQRGEHSLGFIVSDAADGPADTHVFRGVDVSGLAEAHLSLNATFLAYWNEAIPETCAYLYRVNGGAWREHWFTGPELALSA